MTGISTAVIAGTGVTDGAEWILSDSQRLDISIAAGHISTAPSSEPAVLCAENPRVKSEAENKKKLKQIRRKCRLRETGKAAGVPQ